MFWCCFLCQFLHLINRLLRMNRPHLFPLGWEDQHHRLLPQNLCCYNLCSNFNHNCFVLFLQMIILNLCPCCFSCVEGHPLLWCQHPHLIWLVNQRLFSKNCLCLSLKTKTSGSPPPPPSG